MGANKVFLIKLLNNFMEWILIAIQSGGAPAPLPPPPPPQILCHRGFAGIAVFVALFERHY